MKALLFVVACLVPCGLACGGEVEGERGRPAGVPGRGGTQPTGSGARGSDARTTTGGSLSGGVSSETGGIVNQGGSSGTAGGRAIEAQGGRVDQGGTGATSAGGAGALVLEHSCLPERPQPAVAFLVDTSSSMGLMNAPSTHGQSKWALTREFLRETWASLPAQWAVGVTFHNSEITRTVPIQPLGSEQLAALEAALDQVIPAGEASLLSGWQLGLEQLEGFESPALPWESVVLFTDSVPTLNRDGTPGSGLNHSIGLEEYDAVIQAVADQYGLTKTPTLVFGVPGSEDPQGAPYDPLYQLSELALAGGWCPYRPTRGTVTDCYDAVNQRASTCLETRGSYCHVDLTTDVDAAAALSSMLEPIVTYDPSCTFELRLLLDGLRLDPDHVTVTLTSRDGTQRLLARSLDASCTTGDWFLFYSPVDAADESTDLWLCPKACDASVAPDTACLDIAVAPG
jgi:hypothetical protein